jgi:hypothetical protein
MLKRLLPVWLCVLCRLTAGLAATHQPPPFTDYCERLEQEIQGRKHGFLAGNVTYYVGGFHACWKPVEDETIGLTHPFHHDLRSRGVGLLESELPGAENTGRGNDYGGWEFYKDTRVLYGSVSVDGKTHRHPKPKRMRWRPDRMICEYEVGGVTLREVKFIAANDAAASIITASRPVTLRFDGHSFFHRNSVSSSADIRFDARDNMLIISEGGTVKSRPDPDRGERVGPCVYTGMTTVLGASRELTGLELRQDERGVRHYTFDVACDPAGTVVSWAMHDEAAAALAALRDVLGNAGARLAAKTTEMNRQLNGEIPWFRCPDRRVVDIYYYLWALHLMYDIDVSRGWEREPHTQTAVNNFLGMHRYDAAFQIRVGAWTADQPRHAYGNVLTWKHLTKNGHYREKPNGLRLLSDNKGVSWHSGAYGPETSEHVLGAWQIYEHTGDVGFLKECYEDHFRTLFWNGITGFGMNHLEVADRLESMARLTGHEADVPHWRQLVRRDPEHVRRMFAQRWEANGIPDYFAGPKNGMIMTTGFWAMRSPHFPREYAQTMVGAWAEDREKGFFGKFFPLAMARRSMDTFRSAVDHSFGYTPDTAYFTLDGMFRQRLPEAAELTLNHLTNYNWHAAWEIPVAPEAYRRDGTPFGDQYSNFNAGKILLILEGLAGLKYSVPDRRIIFRPALPREWNWIEVRLPIAGRWTRLRRTGDTVEVDGSPFEVLR